ncbi:MAG: single-stranded DNA-binding protein [Candidatus Koribacter versatilis]|uniref:Single-stranded DNA-binding protein n=1 Tax=Candidatus Korobacter versatilis TaxID=658062 RepID=A0A932EPV0_9BACT|nr:single-stranded DNA-binding protein [Candidatus Koribacter versatilis]
MSKSVNKVILIGNLGKDPEVKYTPSGMAVAKFSLATNDRFKDKEGNWQDRTEWHNLVAFQRTAEIVGEYLKKGRTVYIEGKLQTSSWDDKETGAKKYKTEIIVNELVLLGGGQRGDNANAGTGGGSDHESATGGGRSKGASAGGSMDQRPHESAAEITDEDIPF